MASSNFLRLLKAQEKPQSYAEVFDSMEKTVSLYGKRFAVPTERRIRFCELLREEAHEKFPQEAEEENPQVGELAARLWTSNKTMAAEGKSVALYHIIQRALYTDDPDLLEAVMGLIRGINLMCVSDRGIPLSPDAYPTEVFRGGSLPEEHLQFFQQRILSKIRMKSFFATSTEKSVATVFMSANDAPWRVLWVVRFTPGYPCVNVNCLETITAITTEHEFLFPPYSVFTIQSCSFTQAFNHYTIELLAAFDNKYESELLEVAPWG